MKTYSLIVGARTVSGSVRFEPSQEKRLLDITREHFPDGFTLLCARGGWWNASTHRFEKEESREVRVVSANNAKVVQWARAVGTALKQKEVLVTEIGRVRRLFLKSSAS